MTKDEALALSEKQHTFPDKKQPAQEPVAERFLMKDKGKSYWAYSDYDNSKDWQPLYTRPAPLQWISVKDRLPEVDILVLVIQDDKCVLRSLTEENDWVDENFNLDDSGLEITHWMPLPDSPKESNDD